VFCSDECLVTTPSLPSVTYAARAGKMGSRRYNDGPHRRKGGRNALLDDPKYVGLLWRVSHEEDKWRMIAILRAGVGDGMKPEGVMG
jgi:hypothetical protein